MAHFITTSMYLTTTGMGERVSTTSRGQSSPNMSVVTPSSLMVFYTSMYLTCPGLGMRVYTPSMRVPTSGRDLNSP